MLKFTFVKFCNILILYPKKKIKKWKNDKNYSYNSYVSGSLFAIYLLLRSKFDIVRETNVKNRIKFSRHFLFVHYAKFWPWEEILANNELTEGTALLTGRIFGIIITNRSICRCLCQSVYLKLSVKLAVLIYVPKPGLFASKKMTLVCLNG